MPVNVALLSVNKTLSMIEQSILAVQLALDNNPSPPDALELNDQLTDVQTLHDELASVRDQIRNVTVTMPPPDATLISELQKSTSAVEAAAIAGAAASTVLSAVGQALAVGLAVMSLAKAPAADGATVTATTGTP